METVRRKSWLEKAKLLMLRIYLSSSRTRASIWNKIQNYILSHMQRIRKDGYVYAVYVYTTYVRWVKRTITTLQINSQTDGIHPAQMLSDPQQRPTSAAWAAFILLRRYDWKWFALWYQWSLRQLLGWNIVRRGFELETTEKKVIILLIQIRKVRDLNYIYKHGAF